MRLFYAKMSKRFRNCFDMSGKSCNFALDLQRIAMSVQENQQKAMAYIAEQSHRVIDYQWEIEHHRQMHADYESRS